MAIRGASLAIVLLCAACAPQPRAVVTPMPAYAAPHSRLLIAPPSRAPARHRAIKSQLDEIERELMDLNSRLLPSEAP